MKNVIMPKCPYCKLEYKAGGFFNNALSNLYGEYSSDTAEIICANCKKKYFVSKQTKFIARKVR